MKLLLMIIAAGGAYTAGVEGNYWARTQAVTTSACILDEASGDCALFPAGFGSEAEYAIVNTRSDAGAICAWAFDPSETLASGFVIDSAAAAGFRLEVDGDKVTQKPSRTRLIKKQSGGSTVGLCTVAHAFLGESLYAPCDADGDCSTYGGGTCDTTPSITQERGAGLFLYCLADSGTANITVEKAIVE